MRPQKFEQAVLELSMTTRVPLSRANVVFYTGHKSQDVDKWLDEMIRDGLLDFDTDDDGELLYNVCGAKRPLTGGKELVRCTACKQASVSGTRCNRCGQLLDSQLRALKDEVENKLVKTALRKLPETLPLADGSLRGEKNVAVGGALGLLGPLGWFYAAPLKEAALGSAAFLLLWWISKWLVFGFSWLLLPASALMGALYAYKYNREGRRSGLLFEEPEDK
ncbi:MAG TPA: hypothetical protein PKE31_12600 [Pseudomonadota bacterium]|nr:hypothetical protein [Pseudomonadota bacterium]